MAKPQFRMPEFIKPAPWLHRTPMQQVLNHYVMYRNNSALDALHYCTGGIINASCIIGNYKYVLKAGFVSKIDEPSNTLQSKVRVITVIANELNGIPRDDGFFWDSSNQLDLLWGPVSGNYKGLYVLYRNHAGELPEHLDNCVRIASGFYNTLRDEAIEPAAYTDHQKIIRVFTTINWAELIGEWTISPFVHHSMVAFPLPHKKKEDYPANYRKEVDRRRAATQTRPVNLVPPPSYFEALLSQDYSYRDFMKVISLMLSTTLGDTHSVVQALMACDLSHTDLDHVIALLSDEPGFKPVIQVITGNRKTIPLDPWGFCPRVFLLGFQQDDDYIYRDRTLVKTDEGILPYTWPKELFGNLTIEPYCMEQSSGSWLRNIYRPKNIPESIHQERSLAKRKSMLYGSMKPQLMGLPDAREVDSFIGFLKVSDPRHDFGSHQGYDVSRDPGPTLLTNGKGGAVMRLSPWKWSRLLYTFGGIGSSYRTCMNYPPTYEEEGSAGIQVVSPLCNGTVHYVSPPIREDILDSTFDQANAAKSRIIPY